MTSITHQTHRNSIHTPGVVDPLRDFLDRMAPSDTQVETAQKLMPQDYVDPDRGVFTVLIFPGKEYGIWMTGQEVLPVEVYFPYEDRDYRQVARGLAQSYAEYVLGTSQPDSGTYGVVEINMVLITPGDLKPHFFVNEHDV